MTTEHLATALKAVDWQGNVASFLKHSSHAKSLSATSLKLAIWAKQFEQLDAGNPALSFIREMQAATQYVAALIALALYKPASASMRTMLETALYYSYFRTHSDELATLVRDPDFYVDKKEVLEFHKKHTPGFKVLEQKLGLVSRLEKWYGSMSSIIHGQLPGNWTDHNSLSEIKPIASTQDKVIQAFVEGGEIVHRLFLCTAGRVHWDNFSSSAKKQLIAGLPGDVKSALKLDSA